VSERERLFGILEGILMSFSFLSISSACPIFIYLYIPSIVIILIDKLFYEKEVYVCVWVTMAGGQQTVSGFSS
jgi:hypothetical protein